ncbi:MAG: flippase-like domain-containing protein [Methanomicrobiales archaeon]|jgi:uncharacterized protein (TIRG00374 family)|nr:flippase-like domain-containing protein [Methanomicrobiales archaeon]
MNPSQKKWIWISLIFSVLVLFIIILSTVDENTFDYLQSINIWFLLAAIALRFISFALWALRIKLMSHSLGYQVSFLHCFNMVIANLLIGALTPGQTGGEPVRIHELYRVGVQIGDATAIVVLERVFDAVILVLFGIFSLIFLFDVMQSLSMVIVGSMLIAIALMALAIGMLIYALYRPDTAKRLVMKTLFWSSEKIKRPLAEKVVTRIDIEFDNFIKSSIAFSNISRNGLYTGMACSVLFWVSEFIVASVILMGLGIAPYISESFLFQIVIAVISMIPLTPGASGVAEISATSLYALVVPTSILGVFVLIWRLIMFYLNVFAGFIGSLVIFRRELHVSSKRAQGTIDRVYSMQEQGKKEMEEMEEVAEMAELDEFEKV